uniref:Uncharacterized protein n=1 Tax=Peronospora matthiolae TaxID=2874970 RepID=A0AAV1UUQ6_9STRA
MRAIKFVLSMNAILRGTHGEALSMAGIGHEDVSSQSSVRSLRGSDALLDDSTGTRFVTSGTSTTEERNLGPYRLIANTLLSFHRQVFENHFVSAITDENIGMLASIIQFEADSVYGIIHAFALHPERLELTFRNLMGEGTSHGATVREFVRGYAEYVANQERIARLHAGNQ